jgi:hypothetical protein
LGEKLSFTTCILETGKRYPEAIGLYKKWIPYTTNYGQYIGIGDSLF